MHGIPKGKRKLITRENIISQLVILILVVAAVIISFVNDIKILKVLSIIGVAVVAIISISYYTIEFFTGAAYNIASILNELLYLIVGVPILVISAGFLPVSVYMAFFNPDSLFVNIALLVFLGFVEVLAIAYIFRRYLRERKMTLGQYIKHLFDFRRRAEEQEKFKERTQQIDSFYDDLTKVEDRIARKLEEKSAGFEEFDWREKVRQMEGKARQEVICWNCQAVNEENSLFCENCRVLLKKQQ